MERVNTVGDDDIEVVAINIDADRMDFADLGFANQADLDAFIQEGIDSVEQHGTIPHDEVMAQIDTILARHRPA